PTATKTTPLEEAINQFVKISQTNFENMQSTVADVQTQLGQLSRLITNILKNSNVDAPTKEVCKAVGKRMEKIERKTQEKEAIEFKIFKKWFKKIEITLEDAYRAFLNEMEELHEKELRSKLPPKLPDPGKFTIPCSINRVNIEEALLDLGSSINLMPLTLVKKYNMGRITISNKVELLMANKSIVNATGIIEDVLVKVNDLTFPVDFVVMDIDLADEKDIILGRPFLATSHACINMKLGKLKIEMNDEEEESSESEDTSSEESNEETEISDTGNHTDDDYLEREADELRRLLYNIKSRDTTTLKIYRATMREGI
ncbi:hypothetical protein A2U01_0004665, partial [Trifolium medium]|nr:hypothetical protein [Trifolium medium]